MSRFTLWRGAALAAAVFGLLTAPIRARAASPSAAHPSDAASRTQVDGMQQSISDGLSDQADAYWHQGDYPRIIAVDRVIGECDPQDVQAFSNGGWLMESDGDDKSAEAFYQMGCRANPQSSFMAFQLAFFYFNTVHRYDKCIAVLKRSTHYPNAGINDWKMLAHAYTNAHDYSQALATWQTIKRRWPNGVAVDHNLQEAEANMHRHRSTAMQH